MAKIPAGLTKRETPLEEILSTLVDTLGDSEKSEVLEYQKELKAVKSQVTKLEKEKEARESAAKSFGLSSDALEPMLKEYEKAIEASSENFRKISGAISKNLGSILGSETVKEKLSEDQIENLKALVEVSENVKNIKKDEGRKKSSDLAKNVKSSADRLTTALLESSISMFGVVTRPLEDLLGFKISDIIKGGFSKIFNKKEKTEDTGKYLQKKVRPEANSLKNLGVIGASAVFLGNIITKLLGKGKDKDYSGILDTLGDVAPAGGATKGVTSALAKAGGIAALAGGIIWGVVDSISAVLKSGKWGVSKVSAGIAGFLSGSGEGGLKDAFKGMGKWALMGAGIGSVVPVIGTITGGLVGAAIGGILGWIGGEKTAKFFDKIGDWFKGAWDSIKNFFVETIPNFVLSIGSWLEEKYTALHDFFFVTIPAQALSAWKGLKSGVKSIVNKVVGFAISIKDAVVEVYTSVVKAVVGFYHNVIDFFTVTLPAWATEKYNSIVTGLKEFFTPAYNAITGFFGSVKNFFVVTIPTWATEKYNDVVTFATGIFDFAKDGVLGFFGNIKNFFVVTIPTWATEKFNEVVSFATGIFDFAKDGVLGFFGSVKNFFTVDIPTFASNAFTKVKEAISGFFDIPRKAIIGFFDDIGIDITSPTLIKDALASISKSFKEVFDKIKNAIADFLSKINPINWIKEKIDKIKDPDQKSWWQFWKPDPDVEDVNDALIFKDGNVYRPAPDDHIIATKTAPTLFNQNGQVVNTGFNSDSEHTRNSSREIQSIQSPIRQEYNSKAFDSMVSLLSSILDVLRDKEMAPSYTDISVPRSLDFEMLR